MTRLNLHRILILLGAFLISVLSYSQGIAKRYERYLTDPASYVCYRTNGKIKIDGKLNEADWKNAPLTEPFVDISGAFCYT